MTDHCIVVSQEQGIQRIQLNRPEKKNALTLAMYRDITAALTSGEANDDIHVHVLLGSSNVFSAGNDIHDFLNNMSDTAHEPPPVLDFLHRLATLTKPIVVGVNGPAIGIGTTLLLHCDLVVLGESARLRTPFVDLGLCPEAGSSLLMPRLLGHVRAAELLLLGQEIDAHTALNWGLANRVVSPAQVEETVQQFAQTLAEKPIRALQLSKRLMKSETTTVTQECITTEANHFMKQLSSEEAQNAFTAFLKR